MLGDMDWQFGSYLSKLQIYIIFDPVILLTGIIYKILLVATLLNYNILLDVEITC